MDCHACGSVALPPRPSLPLSRGLTPVLAIVTGARAPEALTSRVIVEQAKGFLRAVLDVSVEEAFRLLRTYARARREHLTDVAHRLMTDRHSRPILVTELAELLAAPPR